MLDTTVKASSETISRLHVPDPEELPEETRRIVERGGNWNWLRAMALSPNTLRRFMTYYADILDPKKGSLPLHERELIGVVVSTENGCGYCEINHTRNLAQALKDPVQARRIALDHHLASLSERERALADLAVKITHNVKSVDQSDFQRLRDVGLDDDEIFEAIEISAWFNHSNRLAIPLGIVPDERFFNP